MTLCGLWTGVCQLNCLLCLKSLLIQWRSQMNSAIAWILKSVEMMDVVWITRLTLARNSVERNRCNPFQGNLHRRKIRRRDRFLFRRVCNCALRFECIGCFLKCLPARTNHSRTLSCSGSLSLNLSTGSLQSAQECMVTTPFLLQINVPKRCNLALSEKSSMTFFKIFSWLAGEVIRLVWFASEVES